MLKKRKKILHNGFFCKGSPLCINGQSVNKSINKLRYGLSRIADNGCELLSVYNALALIGEKPDFLQILDVAKRHFRIKWLFGLFGSRPWKLHKLITYFNQKYIKIKSDYNKYLHNNGIYIVSFFNRHSLKIHTVAFTCDINKNITVYNRYSNINSSFKYNSDGDKTGLDKLFEETGRRIIMYEIQNQHIDFREKI